MHVHLTGQLVNQSLSGKRVPEASSPLQRIVELFLTPLLIEPESTFNFLYSFTVEFHTDHMVN